MKKISIISILLACLVSIFSCKKDETKAVLSDTKNAPVITTALSGTTKVLLKPNADVVLGTINWTKANYGVVLGTLYTLQVDKKSNNFKNSVNILSTTSTKADLVTSVLNTSLVALGLDVEKPYDLEFRIMTTVPNSLADTLYSASFAMNVTAYQAKDSYYLVGQYNGWNNATAMEFNKYLTGLKYEIYLYMSAVDQGFKILPKLGSWDGDIGDDPANHGKLIPTGENNMTVSTPGFYLIEADMSKMTWKSTQIAWGVIGSATAGGWDSDQNMTVNTSTGVWSATLTLTAGEIKFRANDSWDINLGDTGADGTLEYGGSNIVISSAGSYTTTLNVLSYPYKYTVVKN